MRLICPACKAAYEVPDVRIGAGIQRLRCTRCTHEWTLQTAPAAPPPLPRVPPLMGEDRHWPPARLPGADESPAAPAPPPNRQALLAWAASLVVVAGLAGAAVQFRAEIMHGWPPSQRLFGLFGAALPGSAVAGPAVAAPEGH